MYHCVYVHVYMYMYTCICILELGRYSNVSIIAITWWYWYRLMDIVIFLRMCIQFTPTCHAWAHDQWKDGINRVSNKKSKSIVWRHLVMWGKEMEKSRKTTVICRLCKWKIPCFGNTTNLFAHLQNHYKAQYLELEKVPVFAQYNYRYAIYFNQYINTVNYIIVPALMYIQKYTCTCTCYFDDSDHI